MEKFSTLRVGFETKKGLDKLKVHPRETYDSVIARLVKGNGG